MVPTDGVLEKKKNPRVAFMFFFSSLKNIHFAEEIEYLQKYIQVFLTHQWKVSLLPETENIEIQKTPGADGMI